MTSQEIRQTLIKRQKRKKQRNRKAKTRKEMLDFAQFCILTAFILAVFSIRGYRLIAFVLFINFMAFEAVASTGLRELGYPLHAVYTVIAGLTVLALRYLRASPALFVIMFLFSLYNLLVVVDYKLYEHFGSTVGFYDNFIPVARANMVIELLFMFLISKGGAYVWNLFKPDRKYHYLIDRFFSDCWRMGHKGLV